MKLIFRRVFCVKRFLSVLLCALCFFALLQDSVSVAGAVTEINWTSPKAAYVGERLTWEVTGVRGMGPYEYRFLLYKDDQLVASAGFSDNSSADFLADGIGVYHCVVSVNDKGFCNVKDFQSAPVQVSAWPSVRITGVEAANGTALKITWTPVKDARRYELYRATNKAGPYKLVKATTALSVVNAYLTAGTRYYYKVRFLNARGTWSPLSACAAGVPIARPVIKSAVSPASGQARLVWSKVAGASGYQVLLSASPAGPYRVVGTLSGTAAGFSGLRKGSRLFFQVRPYRKVCAAAYYGPPSACRIVPIK